QHRRQQAHDEQKHDHDAAHRCGAALREFLQTRSRSRGDAAHADLQRGVVGIHRVHPLPGAELTLHRRRFSVRHQAIPTRGLRTRYRMSTARLISTTMTPSTSTPAWIIGKSRNWMAWKMVRPMPGQEKMDSRTTVPPSRLASWRPLMVTVGISALRSVYL